MNVPNAPSCFFLAYLLFLLPCMAWRSAQRFRAARAAAGSTSESGSVPPSRMTIWKGVLFLQVVLLVFAWLVAGTFEYSIFAGPAFRMQDVIAGCIALLTCFALRQVARMSRSDEERRSLAVYAISPRSREERMLRNVTVMVTAVAEEAAYRGVAVQILWYALGSVWPAVLISAIAFALAHALQGWKSMFVIFGFALVAHGLVLCTDTLIYAMIAHAVYDLAAGYWISEEAKRFDAPSTIAG